MPKGNYLIISVFIFMREKTRGTIMSANMNVSGATSAPGKAHKKSDIEKQFDAATQEWVNFETKQNWVKITIPDGNSTKQVWAKIAPGSSTFGSKTSEQCLSDLIAQAKAGKIAKNSDEDHLLHSLLDERQRICNTRGYLAAQDKSIDPKKVLNDQLQAELTQTKKAEGKLDREIHSHGENYRFSDRELGTILPQQSSLQSQESAISALLRDNQKPGNTRLQRNGASPKPADPEKDRQIVVSFLENGKLHKMLMSVADYEKYIRLQTNISAAQNEDSSNLFSSPNAEIIKQMEQNLQRLRSFGVRNFIQHVERQRESYPEANQATILDKDGKGQTIEFNLQDFENYARTDEYSRLTQQRNDAASFRFLRQDNPFIKEAEQIQLRAYTRYRENQQNL